MTLLRRRVGRPPRDHDAFRHLGWILLGFLICVLSPALSAGLLAFWRILPVAAGSMSHDAPAYYGLIGFALGFAVWHYLWPRSPPVALSPICGAFDTETGERCTRWVAPGGKGFCYTHRLEDTLARGRQ